MYRCEVCNVDCNGPGPFEQHQKGKQHQKMVDRKHASLGATQNIPLNKVLELQGVGVEFNGLTGFCQHCQVALTSPAVAEQHVAGKQHLRRVTMALGLSGSQSFADFPANRRETEFFASNIPAPTAVVNDFVRPSNLDDSVITDESAGANAASAATPSRVAGNDVSSVSRTINEYLLAQRPQGFNAFCNICNVPLNTLEQYEKHVQSPKHIKKEEQHKRGVVMSSDRTAWHTCDICGKQVNSAEQLVTHRKSHDTLLRKISSMDGFVSPYAAALSPLARASGDRQSVTDSKMSPTNANYSLPTRGIITNPEPSFSLKSDIGKGQTARKDIYSGDYIVRGSGATYSARRNPEPVALNLVSDDDETPMKAPYIPRRVEMLQERQRQMQQQPQQQQQQNIATVPTGRLITGRRSDDSISLPPGVQVQDESMRQGSLHKSLGGVSGIARNIETRATPPENVRSSGNRSNSGSEVRASAPAPVARLPCPSSDPRCTYHCFICPYNSHHYDKRAYDDHCISSNHANIYGDDITNTKTQTRVKTVDDGPPESRVSPPRDSGYSTAKQMEPQIEKQEQNSSVDEALVTSFTELKLISSDEMISAAATAANVAPAAEESQKNPFAYFPFYCALCNVPFDTMETQEAHMRGRKHRQSVAKNSTAPDRDLDRIVNNEDEANCTTVAFECSEHVPRPYQVELFVQAMKGNKVIFLPTGTGKTLVSAMVVWHFLELNPRRPVMFLVDKVLLVLQQQNVLKQQFGERTMKRYNEATGLLEYRQLRVASLCGGDQRLVNNLALWEHDVIVATAAFYRNLLERNALRWADNCLVVFDEAHHCSREHPFNAVLREWHLTLPANSRPMLLGLTASPAGKESIAATEKMLRQLLTNMGGTQLVMVEYEAEVLRRYQSSAQLIMKKIDLSPDEMRFSACVRSHLKACLERMMKDVSSLGRQLTFVSTCLEMLSDDLEEGLHSDVVDNVLNALQDTWTDDNNTNVVVRSLIMHIRELAAAFLDMRDVGLMAACHELEVLLAPSFQGSFKQLASLGIQCDELVAIIQHHVDQSRNSNLTASEDETLKSMLPVFRCVLAEILKVNWTPAPGVKSDDRPIVLVLVKTRKMADLLCRLVQNDPAIQAKGLNAVHLVGHGTSGAQGRGMTVQQQQKKLKDIHALKAQIIFATSVAEEGLDLPNCELVIQLDPPTTVQALVQIRGRARKKNSQFLALFRDDFQLAAMEALLQREKFMIAAVRNVIDKQRRRDSDSDDDFGNVD